MLSEIERAVPDLLETVTRWLLCMGRGKSASVIRNRSVPEFTTTELLVGGVTSEDVEIATKLAVSAARVKVPKVLARMFSFWPTAKRKLPKWGHDVERASSHLPRNEMK